MARIHTRSVRIDADAADAFCALHKDFADQFVYAHTSRPLRHFGLGRCIAVADLADIETPASGAAPEAPESAVAMPSGGEAMPQAEAAPEASVARPPVAFTFRRFDDGDPREADPLFASFPRVAFMIPEIVITEDATGTWLQVNSLGPVYSGRIARFAARARAAAPRRRETPRISVERDDPREWEREVAAALAAIEAGRVAKLVLARRLPVRAAEPFSFKDVLLGLLDGPAEGTVFGYRYGDVFFVGCTPELLLRACAGGAVESMCLAGSSRPGGNLLASAKDRREHEYVVDHIRSVAGRNCYDVRIPAEPGILRLPTIWHLHTPVAARLLAGRSSWDFASQLYPTPALSGLPVGEALMALRGIEGFNRGFFGGVAGVARVGGDGRELDAEYSVTIRSGVFDGERGYVYAGCGIVAGSDAAAEYRETDLKFATILSAFEATWGDAEACDAGGGDAGDVGARGAGDCLAGGHGAGGGDVQGGRA